MSELIVSPSHTQFVDTETGSASCEFWSGPEQEKDCFLAVRFIGGLEDGETFNFEAYELPLLLTVVLDACERAGIVTDS